jgi:hypothetical protein
MDLRVYPNPVGNVMTVRYTLPASGLANISLYDITGKLVSTLVNGHYRAGTYACRLSRGADRLPAGVYLLRFEREGYRTTEKLIFD